jgi:hypothetical protein
MVAMFRSTGLEHLLELKHGNELDNLRLRRAVDTDHLDADRVCRLQAGRRQS